MSISDTVKKVMPYLKTASGYVLHRLSSQAVEMDDGTTLEQKVTSLNSLISQKIDSSDVVNNCLTTESGFVLDARQGKALDDKITELNGNISGLKTDISSLQTSVNTKEPTQKRTQLNNIYYKNGYNCFLHANADSAKDVITTLPAAYRPRSAATVSGLCRNTNTNGYYPCVGVIAADGKWDYVSALQNTGDETPYYIYHQNNGTDVRSRFQLWLSGAWSTNTNGA